MLTVSRTSINGLTPFHPERIEKGCWINLIKPTVEELKFISDKTQVQLDFLRAALDREELSRIEVEPNEILVVTNIPILDEEENNFDTLPLGIIITNDVLITVCLRDNKVLSFFCNENAYAFDTNKRSRFLLQVLYRSAKLYLKNVRYITQQIDVIETNLRKSIKNNALYQLLDWQKSMVYFTTSLKDNEIVLKKLLRLINSTNQHSALKKYEDDEDLLEDVLIENKQALETVETHNNILTSMMDAFASIISNNLNIVMKFLTSVTILLAIPTMIASFWGMNVHVPFISSIRGFVFAVVFSLIATAICAYILWKKEMFSTK